MADQTTWKGNAPNAPVMTVCPHMPAMLNELARLVTVRTKAARVPDFYVKGIAGFGSFRSNASSGGTDRGSHIDLNLVGLTDAQRKVAEACAREIGFYADIRPPRWWSPWFGRWITAKWQWHLHMLPVGDPHLSAPALAQIAEWKAGENGLVGEDKDDGPRTFVGRTWAAYLAIKNGVTGVAQSVINAAKVKALQAAVRQRQDGKWGPVTDTALYRTWIVRQQGRAKFNAYNLANRRAMQGSWGTTPDGVWGPKTQAANLAAIKKMQKALGVPVDGIWGRVSYWALMTLRRKVFRP